MLSIYINFIRVSAAKSLDRIVAPSFSTSACELFVGISENWAAKGEALRFDSEAYFSSAGASVRCAWAGAAFVHRWLAKKTIKRSPHERNTLFHMHQHMVTSSPHWRTRTALVMILKMRAESDTGPIDADAPLFFKLLLYHLMRFLWRTLPRPSAADCRSRNLCDARPPNWLHATLEIMVSSGRLWWLKQSCFNANDLKKFERAKN